MIEKIEKSQDLCAEAGWYGYDIMLTEAVSESFMMRLKPLGNLVYLSGLKQPFFKLENRGYLIKGVLGAYKIRIGVAYNDREVLEKIIASIDAEFSKENLKNDDI